MTMEIRRSYNNSQNSYAEQVKEKQETQKAGKAEETGRGSDDIKVSDRGSEPHDEYISSEKAGLKPTGLYQVGQDGDGNRKIYFDDPNKFGDAKGRKQPGADVVNQGNSAEKGMEEDAKEAREKAESDRESNIRKRKEEQEELEKRIEEKRNRNKDTVEISEDGRAVRKENADQEHVDGNNGIDAEASQMKPVIYTKTGESGQSRSESGSSLSVSI